MNLKSLFFGLIIIAFFVDCESDSESDLRAPVPKLVKYTESIKPIISAKCSSCHNGVSLPSYNSYIEAKNEISEILIRIQKDEGATGFMPQGSPKLSQADINLFLKWQTDGLLEQ